MLRLLSRLVWRYAEIVADSPSPEMVLALAQHDEGATPSRIPEARVVRLAMPLAALAVLGMLASCARHDEQPSLANTAPVRVDGSSTVYLVSMAVAEELGRRQGLTAHVEESGTTGGFRKFCRGAIDVTGASRPIQRDEIDACKAAGVDFIELPIGYDGLAVVVNVRNEWVDRLTVAELRTMWAPEATNKVTSWHQIRDSFPDRPLHLFGAGGDSGTFDYFTQAIVGTQRASRTDYTGSEDDTVLVNGVAADDTALGYFGLAYVSHNTSELKLVPIDGGAGPIAPSKQTVANGSYQPLSRPLFIYVSAAAVRRPEVDRFVSFYLSAAHELAAEVGYVALPTNAGQLAQARYEARRTGSMFAGGAPTIGVTVEKLLEAQER